MASRKQRLFLGEITTSTTDSGALSVPYFLQLLGETWGTPTYHSIDEPLWNASYLLAWDVVPILTNGKLADGRYEVEFCATPATAVSFTLWYRHILPSNVRLGLNGVRKRTPAFIEVANTTTEVELLRYLDTTTSSTARADVSSLGRARDTEARLKAMVDRAQGETDPQRAVRLARQIIRRAPETRFAAAAHAVIGNWSMQVGAWQRADAAFTESLALNANQPLIIFARGEARMHLHQASAARADFAQVVDLADGLSEFAWEVEQAREIIARPI